MKLQSVFVAALAAFSLHAHAQPIPPVIVPAFVEFDLASLGDKLVTYDTETRLEWLDVRLTERVSYNQTLLTTYVVQQGFRHATDSEVRELLANFGITVTAARSAENYAPIRRMLDLMGPGYDAGTAEVLSGVYKSNSSNPIDAGWLSVDVPTDGTLNGLARITTDVFMHADAPLDGTGNFLVRRIDVGDRLQQLLSLSTGTGPGKILQNYATTVQSEYASTCNALWVYRAQTSALRQRGLITTAQNDALRRHGLVLVSAIGCE